MGNEVPQNRQRPPIPLAYQGLNDRRRTVSVPGIIGSVIHSLIAMAIGALGVLFALEGEPGFAVIALPVAAAFIAIAAIVFREAFSPDRQKMDRDDL